MESLKICVLLSSYDNANSAFQEVGDEYQDPSLYVDNQEFTLVPVTKAESIEKIKELTTQGYHFIWNYLWGSESEEVAGIGAIKFLESTGHPMLGASSKFVGLTKLDFKRSAALVGIQVP